MDWSGHVDSNHGPPGSKPGTLTRLRYAPSVSKNERPGTRTRTSYVTGRCGKPFHQSPDDVSSMVRPGFEPGSRGSEPRSFAFGPPDCSVLRYLSFMFTHADLNSAARARTWTNGLRARCSATRAPADSNRHVCGDRIRTCHRLHIGELLFDTSHPHGVVVPFSKAAA